MAVLFLDSSPSSLAQKLCFLSGFSLSERKSLGCLSGLVFALFTAGGKMQRTFFYIVSGFVVSQLGLAGTNHIGERTPAPQSAPQSLRTRPENKNWNPHALVASMLERLSPKPDTWGEPTFDSFEMTLKSIRLRAKNLASDFNEAEQAALGTEAARLENAQRLILSRFEAIKEETKSTATPDQKENIEKLIQIFQIRLEEARKAKELTWNLSKQ